MRRWLAAAAFGWLAACAPSADSWPEPQAKPGDAIGLLFAMAPLPTAGMEGCDGALPGIEKPRLSDVLASRLSVFAEGDNSVAGSCDSAGACQVTMAHAEGEDVSAAEFRFAAPEGRPDPASVRCLTTP